MALVTVRISQVFMFNSETHQVIVDKFPGKISMIDAKAHAKKSGLKFTHKNYISETFEVDDITLLNLRPGGFNLERETIN